jgi:multidrug resistance protein, MATE family
VTSVGAQSPVTELRVIARHAGTVLVGQLAVMAFGIADTIVAGRYSQDALAALSVGSAVYISVFVGLMGMLQALLPTWAELHGGKRHEDLGRSVRQALYLCALGTVAGCVALLFPGGILEWTEVPLALQDDVRSYLAVLALALPPALLFRMFSTLNQSLGKPAFITILQALALVVKVPLTIWFVFGGWGLTAQGAVGCAWATVVVQYLLLGCSVWLLRNEELYSAYAIWRPMERPDWRVIGDFARLGVPGGLAVMVEVTSFTLMALFIARQGTIASAAHQVASNLAAVMYMMPLSIAIATSARVSFWLGSGEAARARAVIRTGFKLGLAMSLLLSAALVLFRNGIAATYSSNAEGYWLGSRSITSAMPRKPCACSCSAAIAWLLRRSLPIAFCYGVWGWPAATPSPIAAPCTGKRKTHPPRSGPAPPWRSRR